MKSRIDWLMPLMLLAACAKPTGQPEEVANAFLGAARRQDCQAVWQFFSKGTQEAILVESAKFAKDHPYLGTPPKPEQRYCDRYFSYVTDSATLKKMEGSIAVVRVLRKEPTNFLIPGFFPTKFKEVPEELALVKEYGVWKIDLPMLREHYVEKDKRLRAQEEQRLAAYREEQARVREEIQKTCPETLSLLARWTFEAVSGRMLRDVTGQFTAELDGVQALHLPDGAAVQFAANKEAIILPEELLNDRSCGVISFWFRIDNTNRHARLFHKVDPGVFNELKIEVAGNGRLFILRRGHQLMNQELIQPHRFYHFAFVWNDQGEALYLNGRQDAHSPHLAIIGSRSSLTLIGRDPVNAGVCSTMTLRDLRFYEGRATDADIENIFRQN